MSLTHFAPGPFTGVQHTHLEQVAVIGAIDSTH